MKSILVILPYFGKLPGYFDLWLDSCARNPTVDWLLITDNHLSQDDLPKNFQLLNISFGQFQEMVQNTFDFKISLDRPYKLCDFKPFYGEILRSYVKGYAFWGYCDCDLIFGDIRKFLTDDILEKHEKILGHGHFSLHKVNSEKFQEVLQKVRVRGKYTWREALSSPDNYAIDEYDHFGISFVYRDQFPECIYTGYSSGGRIYDDVFSDIGPFLDPENDGKDAKKVIVYRRDEMGLYRVILENNQVRDEEVIYLHLMKRPMARLDTGMGGDLYIAPGKFLRRSRADRKIIQKYGRCFFDVRKLKYDFSKWRARLKLGQRLKMFLMRNGW